MAVLHLIDGPNVVRRKLEGGARIFREIYHETLQLPAHVVPIWCWEGFHAKECRRALHPDYKAQRTPPADGTFEVIKTVQELLRHTRALQVKVPHREADDAIGHLANLYAGEHDIFIVSNDSDFTQLCTLPGVRVEKQAKIDPQYLRLYKATVGDTSDNIPGIKGFGQGGWDKIVDFDDFARRYHAWLAGGDWHEFPELRPGSNTWLCTNRELARVYWQIVGFFGIDADLLAENTHAGTPDGVKAIELCRRFMQ